MLESVSDYGAGASSTVNMTLGSPGCAVPNLGSDSSSDTSCLQSLLEVKLGQIT